MSGCCPTNENLFDILSPKEYNMNEILRGRVQFPTGSDSLRAA